MSAMKKWLALFLALVMIPWAAVAEVADAAETEEAVEAGETAEEAPEAEETEAEAAGEPAEDEAEWVDEEEPASHTVECRTYPYLRCFDDEDGEVFESTMNLYFVDGLEIPYVALSEYFPFFGSLMMDYDEWELQPFTVRRIEEDTPGLDSYFVERSDNNTSMIVLPSADQIWFDSYNLFMAKPGVMSLVSALDLPEPAEKPDILAMLEEAMALAEEMQARGEEIPEGFYDDYFATVDPALDHTFFLNAGGSYNRHGNGTILDLREYGIALYSIDGECYVPFQTMNDLFMNDNYLQFIFNGRTVFGAAYGCDEFLSRAHEAEPEEMSLELANYNYYELLFLLDTFYGLKPEHEIWNFRDMINHNTNLSSKFITGSAQDFDDALMLLLGFYLDDLHSGFGSGSWRASDGSEEALFQEMLKYFSAVGYSNANYMSESFRHGVPREAAYPDGVPGYEEIDDTAFVTFDGFHCTAVTESYSEYYDLGVPATLEECGDDTIRLIQYANEQIRRENSPVRNVVIDLSNNGGGSVAAAVAVLCWYLGETSFALRDTMTGAMSIMHYTCDLNVDEHTQDNAGDSLTEIEGLHLYCIISPLSFSCGNLVPAIFKESHRVTLIGQRSGGGACVVLPCTSASGTTFQISGTKQIAMVRNGSFYNVDQGVEPDIPLTRIESFYDRPGLVELIHTTR